MCFFWLNVSPGQELLYEQLGLEELSRLKDRYFFLESFLGPLLISFEKYIRAYYKISLSFDLTINSSISFLAPLSSTLNCTKGPALICAVSVVSDGVPGKCNNLASAAVSEIISESLIRSLRQLSNLTLAVAVEENGVTSSESRVTVIDEEPSGVAEKEVM